MQTFAHASHRAHSPEFFLQRGMVRRNFEIPARAEALLKGLQRMGAAPSEPPSATREQIGRVHTDGYLDFLQHGFAEWSALPEKGAEIVPSIHPSPEMIAQGARPPATIVGQSGWYTADTSCPVGPGTWEAAAGAAGCALAAAEAVGKGGRAYALCRPPGHHAYAARGGGHCYLNNTALAADALRRAGAARVAVLDIDSHHGNGTQGIFWERGDVLTVSVHGDPNRYYPWYVGHAEERGAGAGDGANCNLPLAFGTGDSGWLEAVESGLGTVRGFKPDAVVIALGFDASEHEPLASMAVTADGFARAGAAISALGLPTAVVQEGGYAVDVLDQLIERFLGAF